MAETRFEVVGLIPVERLLAPLARLLRRQREARIVNARNHPDFAVLMTVSTRVGEWLKTQSSYRLVPLGRAEG